MNKKVIRKQMLLKRKSLPKDTYAKASKTINQQILSLSTYKKSKKIGLYMGFNNEINLNEVWQNALQNSKSCFFPRVQDARNMHFYKAEDLNDFIKNKWGILEPLAKTEDYLAPSALEIIILPLVAFDITGHRIGMGAGYYDKALQNCGSTTLVGVGYEFQKVASINAETWDIKLDIMITEKEIYFF